MGSPLIQGSVSVVVPCYRCARTLPRAILSVAGQTLRPLEILVVDDASRDESPEAIELERATLGRDPVRLITLDVNRGASSARNAGWDAARGDFVAFLDADDEWHPRKLELQYAFMLQHPDLVVSGHAHAFATPPEIPDGALRWRMLTCRELLWRNRFVTPSAMVRRDAPLRFRDGQRHMEDHLLWASIACSGGRIAFIDAPLAILHKAQFGAGGLSGQLLAMERAELGNYRLLWAHGAFPAWQLPIFWLWSWARFVRRLMLVLWRRCCQARPARRNPR